MHFWNVATNKNGLNVVNVLLRVGLSDSAGNKTGFRADTGLQRRQTTLKTLFHFQQPFSILSIFFLFLFIMLITFVINPCHVLISNFIWLILLHKKKIFQNFFWSFLFFIYNNMYVSQLNVLFRNLCNYKICIFEYLENLTIFI